MLLRTAKYSSDVEEVKGILKALAGKISSSEAVLDCQGIGNALYGLQNMSSNDKEVIDVLKCIARKISSSNAALD